MTKLWYVAAFSKDGNDWNLFVNDETAEGAAREMLKYFRITAEGLGGPIKACDVSALSKTSGPIRWRHVLVKEVEL